MINQTIAQKLAEIRKASMLDRADKLESIGAPQVVIDTLRKNAETPLKGVGKLKEFGDLTFTDFNTATGYGGRPYIRFCVEGCKDVLYVKSQYGWYLKITHKK